MPLMALQRSLGYSRPILRNLTVLISFRKTYVLKAPLVSNFFREGKIS